MYKILFTLGLLLTLTLQASDILPSWNEGTSKKNIISYDRTSHIGKLDKGLDYGLKNNWMIVDMKND